MLKVERQQFCSSACLPSTRIISGQWTTYAFVLFFSLGSLQRSVLKSRSRPYSSLAVYCDIIEIRCLKITILYVLRKDRAHISINSHKVSWFACCQIQPSDSFNAVIAWLMWTLLGDALESLCETWVSFFLIDLLFLL